MATQIARKGQTVTVEIPEDLLRKANLSVGDAVEWTLTPTGALSLSTPRDAGTTAAEDDYEHWKKEEIQAGFAELDAGESAPNEKVIDWLRSWGDAHELPPPL
jgi:antitoxin component of MazEF toxin-antitoxin module